jgi:hypothetical protein
MTERNRRMPPTKHTVTVWGKPYEVIVYQKSKSVWEAVGTYAPVSVVPGKTSEEIRVTDRSESAALKRWVEAAGYRGN